jgi:ferredoxin--NADP+ reductase
MSKWVEGRVVENRCHADGLFVLQVDAAVQPFRAGQYTKLALDVERERIARPYSFVNPPSQDLLEFYFNRVPEGDFTTLLGQLEGGDQILVSREPSGFFTLDEVPEAEHLWLLATGTAIGPFISMLKTDEPWRRFSKIVLVHGVRQVGDLIYRDAITELEAANPDKFVMVPFVTREGADFAMTGHIQDAISDGTLEQRVGMKLGPDQSQVMICGNPSMIKDTKEVLSGLGLKKNLRRKPGHVTTEHYWQDD